MVKLLTSEQSGQGLTNSTLQSYPAESPRNKRPVPSSPASYASSNLDRAKVNELRQVLHVDQQMHGTEELLADSLVITEESKVSENNRTVVKRVKVQGHWLAKKIYKHSDREQGEREIYLQEVEVLKLLHKEASLACDSLVTSLRRSKRSGLSYSLPVGSDDPGSLSVPKPKSREKNARRPMDRLSCEWASPHPFSEGKTQGHQTFEYSDTWNKSCHSGHGDFSPI